MIKLSPITLEGHGIRLESLTLEHEADLSACEEAEKIKAGSLLHDGLDKFERKNMRHAEITEVEKIKTAIKDTMWNYAGIVRSDKGLEEGLKIIRGLRKQATELFDTKAINSHTAELRSIAEISEMIMTSASMRKESRGLHFNQDHPEKDDSLKKNTILRKGCC